MLLKKKKKLISNYDLKKVMKYIFIATADFN